MLFIHRYSIRSLFFLPVVWVLFFCAHANAAPDLTDSSQVPAFRPQEDVHRGMALGLYDQNKDADYCKDVAEIAALSVTHLSVVVVYFQQQVNSTKIFARPGYTPSVKNIERTLDCAKAHRMQVTLFPIVHIVDRAMGDWRGTIKPERWQDWFDAYTQWISDLARIAQQHQVSSLVVGSEYVSSEKMRTSWLQVIASVRQNFKGQLIYSANWDHFDPVSFWDAVDLIGVTAYHRLSVDQMQPQVDTLVQAWEPVKRRLRQFQKRLQKPLIITEIGYPSLDGANIYPWDETRRVPVDVQEQADCYRAFMRAFAQESFLSGVYFWIWFGAGGVKDGGFSPKNKPATPLIRAFYQRSLSP